MSLNLALFGRRTWLGLKNRHLFDQFHQFDPSAVEAHKKSASYRLEDFEHSLRRPAYRCFVALDHDRTLQQRWVA